MRDILIGSLVGMLLLALLSISYFGVYVAGHEEGESIGYNKYIGTFIPAPYLPVEIPVKKRARLIEKFKG